MSGGRLLVAAILAAGPPSALSAAGEAVPAALAPEVVTWGWVVFGFAAQGLFAARFLVQWLATERAQRVVVPVAFWWLSIAGGLAMLAYFVRRGDPVGMAGQFFGLAVYLRNLVIHHRRQPLARAQVAPEVDG